MKIPHFIWASLRHAPVGGLPFFGFKTAANILACTVCTGWSFCLGHIPQSRRLGRRVYTARMLQDPPLCFPKSLYQFTLPPAALITLGIASLFNCCQSDGCEMVSQCCFNLHFLDYSSEYVSAWLAHWVPPPGIVGHYPLPIFLLSCLFLVD